MYFNKENTNDIGQYPNPPSPPAPAPTYTACTATPPLYPCRGGSGGGTWTTCSCATPTPILPSSGSAFYRGGDAAPTPVSAGT